jgi:hypothetical protein
VKLPQGASQSQQQLIQEIDKYPRVEMLAKHLLVIAATQA